MHEPRLTLEAGRVRVEIDGQSYLLRLPNFAAFHKIYAASLKVVCAHFAPARTQGIGLSDEQVASMQREIAMHWIYNYSVNRSSKQVNAADLKHPATFRILYASALAASGDAAQAVTAAAKLAAISEEQFARWLEADTRQQQR